MTMINIKEKLKTLPKEPGVYVMKDVSGVIIYIGKAKNLKNRVSSYFIGAHDAKVTAMVAHIADLEWFVVNTENDALFLEANLIHKHQPKYNILLKDDKKFPYIQITPDGKIQVVRTNKEEGQIYGPYFNGIYVKYLMDIIRSIYHNDPVKAAEFLAGKRYDEVVEVMTNRMQQASAMQQFELAIAYRNVLQMVNRLRNRARVQTTAEDANAFTLGACRELGEILKLKKTPRRIECYDISHTAGEYVVSSMVVFVDGVADKSQYRRFRIKHGQGNNDFLSMEETLTRRLKHHEWAYPDVIVIDGGKGQLGAVPKIDDITYISLAKRFELVYTTTQDEPVVLSHHSYALRLLQRIRDEAHRFAITYHKHLRDKIRM
ncbi:MAG: GIY-YIG nuclease family protein [Clostridia bacterium]|nr:GIY-YIG nuclease family protein [Clostridia bacterium]